jgi:hypothetical protein
MDSAHQGGVSEVFQDQKSFLIELPSIFVIECNWLVHELNYRMSPGSPPPF